jgi:hypothetical protein
MILMSLTSTIRWVLELSKLKRATQKSALMPLMALLRPEGVNWKISVICCDVHFLTLALVRVLFAGLREKQIQ